MSNLMKFLERDAHTTMTEVKDFAQIRRVLQGFYQAINYEKGIKTGVDMAYVSAVANNINAMEELKVLHMRNDHILDYDTDFFLIVDEFDLESEKIVYILGMWNAGSGHNHLELAIGKYRNQFLANKTTAPVKLIATSISQSGRRALKKAGFDEVGADVWSFMLNKPAEEESEQSEPNSINTMEVTEAQEEPKMEKDLDSKMRLAVVLPSIIPIHNYCMIRERLIKHGADRVSFNSFGIKNVSMDNLYRDNLSPIIVKAITEIVSNNGIDKLLASSSDADQMFATNYKPNCPDAREWLLDKMEIDYTYGIMILDIVSLRGRTKEDK